MEFCLPREAKVKSAKGILETCRGFPAMRLIWCTLVTSRRYKIPWTFNLTKTPFGSDMKTSAMDNRVF